MLSGAALVVVADLVGCAVASAVLAPLGVVVVLDCLEHQCVADWVESGVEHAHAGGLVDEHGGAAVAALTIQRRLRSVGIVAGCEVACVAAQHLGCDRCGGFEEFCGVVDGLGAGLPGSVGEHFGVFCGEVAGSEAACDIGHLGDLFADLDGALGPAHAQACLVAQRRAARSRTGSLQSRCGVQQQRLCR